MVQRCGKGGREVARTIFGKEMWMGRGRALAMGVAACTALALCLLALAGAVRPAEAAFPGNNGNIVFWSDRSAGPGLYTKTPGGTATKISGTSGGDNHAAWSPDGSRIVFQSTSATSKEISVMNADGSGSPMRLTNNNAPDAEPAWGANGKILFTSPRGGGWGIHVMNADGSGVTRLSSRGYDVNPHW